MSRNFVSIIFLMSRNSGAISSHNLWFVSNFVPMNSKVVQEESFDYIIVFLIKNGPEKHFEKSRDHHFKQNFQIQTFAAK